MDQLSHRIDRIESTDAIRQLVSRYGMLLDRRDLDALTELFVDDVRVTRDSQGHRAMRAHLDHLMRQFTTSIHWPVTGPPAIPEVYETWRHYWALDER